MNYFKHNKDQKTENRNCFKNWKNQTKNYKKHKIVSKILEEIIVIDICKELDQFVLSLHKEQHTSASAVEEYTAVSNELQKLKSSHKTLVEESTSKVTGIFHFISYSFVLFCSLLTLIDLSDVVDSYDATKTKELAAVKAQIQVKL